MKYLMRILGKGNKERVGFTLVELMIVVIIVGILAAAAVPIYRFAVRKAYMSEAKAALGTIRAAELVYHAENEDFLEIAIGNIGNPVEGTGASGTEGLGIDVTNNTWFNSPSAFRVRVLNVLGTPTGDQFHACVDGSVLTGVPGTVKTIALYLAQDGTFVECTAGTWCPAPT